MAAIRSRIEKANQVARHPKIIVTDLESHLGTRYTHDTLRALGRRFPHTRFIWLMGADNLQQISRWHKGLDIFRIVPVAVFRRPAYPAGRRSTKAAIVFERFWHPSGRSRHLATQSPPAWVILGNKYNTASATSIRKRHRQRKGD
jgi:nicotinate-nucleotide adenylyltransferase